MIKEILEKIKGSGCQCGKSHEFSAITVAGRGMINTLCESVRALGGTHPYVIADKNTYTAAGKRACKLLTEGGMSYTLYVYECDGLEPDERTVGGALMHLDAKCDVIIAVGSGVINDTSKIISKVTGLPYVIVATAPSMDGYQSTTSSMTRDGIKISLPSRSADVIIGDTEILASAPHKMLLSGVGDMLAKYVSICEWRIAALLLGEYYCENIAELIRTALRSIVASEEGIVCGDSKAVEAVFDGLTAGSVAMNYAGCSRPASGIEHYISHIYDMRGAEFGTATDLHGIQCAVATLTAVKLYHKLKNEEPNKEKALAAVAAFDKKSWADGLRNLLGGSAEGMIALEEKEGKYDKTNHAARLDAIIEKWKEIKKIIDEELPSYDELYSFMKRIGLPTEYSEIGLDASLLPEVFFAAGAIRDKYVLPRMLFDLGLEEEYKNYL